MKLKKLLAAVLSLLLIIFACGCDSSAEEYILYLELDEAPSTLDPQLAFGVTEELIVRNIFEGLTRLDSEGKVVNGVAENITVSDDGLTYSFTIRKDAKWSNGDKVTADDFVFALERAVDPATKSPSVALLYSIKNAEEISLGKTGEKLGAVALSDGSLQIVLKEPNNEFLRTLSAAVCMPCNRKAFISAKGKYGMNDNEIVSNGSFSVNYWEKEDKFRLRINKNKEYSGDFTTQASAAIFSVGPFEERAEKLSKNSIDMGFIDANADIENAKINEFSKTCYGLLINKDSAFGKEEFKRAVMSSVHKNLLNNEMGEGLTPADILIPQTVEVQGKPLYNMCNVAPAISYDPKAARESYLEGVGEYGDPGSIEILYFGSEAVKQMAVLLAENFQQALGIVANVKETATENELIESVSAGQYTLAILPITAQSTSAKQYLSHFCSENSLNVYGFSNNKYDSLITRLPAKADEATVVSTANEALKILSDSLLIMPLANLTEGFGYAVGYNCPLISPFNGVIDLALVSK